MNTTNKIYWHEMKALGVIEACVAGANGEVKGKLERGTGV